MKSFELTQDIKPSSRQLDWQKMEYYGMINYGLPTFISKNALDGVTIPQLFAPEELDTDIWAQMAKASGMSGLVLTVKYYDGFCLWQTETTEYSLKSSPWQESKGDLVREVSRSCLKYGLKFGINICVWDNHAPEFKSGVGYNELFKAQLTELCSNYGELFEVRIDDRCDIIQPSPFDYAGVYAIIRSLQPKAAITCAGPDARWVGNNKGFTRKEEWSPTPVKYAYLEDGTVFKGLTKIKSEMVLDIGSRKAIKHDTEFVWRPCEVNLSMRPSIFYNKNDNYNSKTKDVLHKAYENTVGNNSCLMLGLVPNKRGKFHDSEEQILTAFGKDLKAYYGGNLLASVDFTIESSSSLGKLYSPKNCTDDNDDTFFRPAENDKQPEIIIKFAEQQVFDRIILCEHIANGQHMEDFKVFCYNDEKKKWKLFGEASSIGYKRILSGEPLRSSAVKVKFLSWRGFFEISKIIIN